MMETKFRAARVALFSRVSPSDMMVTDDGNNILQVAFHRGILNDLVYRQLQGTRKARASGSAVWRASD